MPRAAKAHARRRSGRQEPAREAVRQPERLQKALAHVGLGSRREAEDWIRAGRLTVNGKLAELGMRVRPSDRVRLDGRLVHQRPAALQQVFLCHRSPGEPLDSASQRPTPGDSRPDSSSLATALVDRLPRSGGRRFIPVSPMPRQDGGLELVTSDGGLAERLQRAVHGLNSEFSVRVHGELDELQIASVLSGELDGAERVSVVSCEPRGGEGANHWYAFTALGASGREARQLFERSGATVSRVLRTRLGTVGLERSLGRGRFRKLTPAELDQLLGGEPATGAARPHAATGRRSSRR